MGGRAGERAGETGLPWASVFDPIANARAFGDVQAQALRAAGDLVERVARSVDGTADGVARGDGEHADADATSLSGDTARFVEVWVDLLQRAADVFGGSARSRPERGERVEVDLDAGSANGLLQLELNGSRAMRTGTAEAWLHNGIAAPVGPLTLHGGELRSADGILLDASLGFDPAYIESMPARSSRGVIVSIAEAREPRPGTYRGLIQVAGAPHVWLAVEIVVREPAAMS
jgi:hypothetical protein